MGTRVSGVCQAPLSRKAEGTVIVEETDPDVTQRSQRLPYPQSRSTTTASVPDTREGVLGKNLWRTGLQLSGCKPATE